MFRTSTGIPVYFKKAVIKGIPLTREELILETIHNGKCLTLKNLWNTLPKEEFGEELTSKNSLKENYLYKMVEKGFLIRDKAEDNLYKKGGYSVNIRAAYKEKLPYTMIGLNPLPAFERVDYMYHLILYKDPKLPYQIYPEEKHEFIDKLSQQAVYLAEKLLKEDASGLFNTDLLNFLNKYEHNLKNGDPNYIYAAERRLAMADRYQQKMEQLPAFKKLKDQIISQGETYDEFLQKLAMKI